MVVAFSKPYAPFLHQMTCQEGAIIPKHLYEGTEILKNPHNTDRPIGTGPFRWKEWVRGSHITMERNPDYFRPGLPYLDRMIAKIIPDQAARTLALEAGEVDFIQSYFLPKERVQQLAKLPALQMMQDTDQPGNFLLFFNMRNKPLDDPRVRQALATALDRQLMVDQVLFGLGTVGRSAIHRAYGWAAAQDVDYAKLYAYDPARAKRMLDEAGYREKGGPRFSILMRITELFQVLPRFFLALLIIALFGGGIDRVILVIGILSWPPTARLVRAEFLSLKQREFVEAARALGQSNLAISFREILPNALPPAIVTGSLDVAQAILLEASLSFFGLGDPNLVSWGGMLNSAQAFLRQAWWMSVFPGTAILLSVLAFNLFGDGVNDALNPRLKAK